MKPKGDVLILAGDIVPFSSMVFHKDFFKYVSDNFAATYWLPGNHEYYGIDAKTKSGRLYETIQPNVWLVNNVAIMHQKVRLLFTTLWTKISEANEWEIEKRMNDFSTIRYNGFRLSAQSYNTMHQECLQFLQTEMKQGIDGKTIVATHHVPTFMHYPPKYKGDVLNEAFAVELFDFISDTQPDYWIYGHHHQNIPPFTIGKTQMLCNQLGYVSHGEHTLFNGSVIIET